jgi:hypothetical protein
MPGVPVCQVPQHARDRPVLVGRRCEGIVVQPVDEFPETLALAVVDLDVRAIVRHHRVLPTVETLNREILSNDNLRPRLYHFRPPGPSFPIRWTIGSSPSNSRSFAFSIRG